VTHRTLDELEAALDEIRRSPNDSGTVELIVRRPAENEREVLEEGRLDVDEGLVGDVWGLDSDGRTPRPIRQLTVTNARAMAAIEALRDRWSLAGDQLYVELDLSGDNLPPGTRLAIGSAEIEITDQPHRACAKFAERFGDAARRFVNSPVGVKLNLRGVNAKVVQSGLVRRGDAVRKL
jgi:hypothetical protein